jgi:predicted nucleotide-binding protein
MVDRRKVFVIHGRDEQARHSMFAFLRDLDLRPLEWEELVRATKHATPFLGDVVVRAFSQAQAVLILLTPDDVAFLHPDVRDPVEPEYETQPTGQARPNVLFEAGMAFGVQPERTIIIEVGGLRPFADLNGRNVIRFDGTVAKLQKIAQRLKGAGCAVNDLGIEWLATDRFTALGAYTRRP